MNIYQKRHIKSLSPRELRGLLKSNFLDKSGKNFIKKELNKRNLTVKPRKYKRKGFNLDFY